MAPSVSHHVEHIVYDTFMLTLFWNAFTWTGFPITSYMFSVMNESSGHYLVSNSTVTTLEYNFTTEGRYCAVFTLSVSANNSLGRGEESVARIGNPIVGMYNGIIMAVGFSFWYLTVLTTLTIHALSSW